MLLFTLGSRSLHKPMSLCDLPHELTLAVLSYLPLSSLSSYQAVCKDWKRFIDKYELSIYRSAAILHEFIPSSATSLSEIESSYHARYLRGVDDWKALCGYILYFFLTANGSSWQVSGDSMLTTLGLAWAGQLAGTTLQTTTTYIVSRWTKPMGSLLLPIKKVV